MPIVTSPWLTAGTVLVVDDERPVRVLVVRALRAAGFKALEAENGQAALDLLAQHAGAVRAVVSDVDMPVMGGRELAQRLAASRPSLPVLLMSASQPNDLQKPFSPAALLERLRPLLHTARSPAA